MKDKLGASSKIRSHADVIKLRNAKAVDMKKKNFAKQAALAKKRSKK